MNHESRPFLRREWGVLALLLLTLLPCLLMGSLLEFALVQLFAHAEGLALPWFTGPFFDNLAGYRGIPLEIMLGCWLGLVIWTLLLARKGLPSQQFRVSFLLGLSVSGILISSIFMCILYACLLPFDYLLVRIEDPPRSHMLLNVVVLLEAVAAVVILTWVILTERGRRHRSGETEK